MYSISPKSKVVFQSEDPKAILKYMDRYHYLYEVRDALGEVMTIGDLQLHADETKKPSKYRNRNSVEPK